VSGVQTLAVGVSRCDAGAVTSSVVAMVDLVGTLRGNGGVLFGTCMVSTGLIYGSVEVSTNSLAGSLLIVRRRNRRIIAE
jgi:hypothetical protein